MDQRSLPNQRISEAVKVLRCKVDDLLGPRQGDEELDRGRLDFILCWLTSRAVVRCAFE
jgi:hypothetical protein